MKKVREYLEKLDNNKRMKIFKRLVFIALILFIIYASLELSPLIIRLSSEKTREQAKVEIANMGVKGVFLVIVMQVIQIIVAVIPGQPMEIISGMLYGTIGGMIVCLIGIFIGTTVVFYIVRKVGMKFVKVFFKDENIKKAKKSKVYKNPQKFEFLMFIIFCIPLIPKDIFIYLGGLSPVRPNRFLIIATLGRIPGLFLTVYAGNRLSEGNLRMVIIMTGVILVLGTIGYYIIQKIENEDNSKTQKKQEA